MIPAILICNPGNETDSWSPNSAHNVQRVFASYPWEGSHGQVWSVT